MDIKDIKRLDNISVKEIKERCYKVSANEGYALKKDNFYTDALYMSASTEVFFEVVSVSEKIKAENKAKYKGKTFEEAKEICIGEIDAYDKSPSVNGFYLNGQLVSWDSGDNSTLNKSVRMGLRQNIKDKVSLGEKEIDMWLGGMKITLPCEKADALMCNLENYAYICFNVTAAHKQAVSKMTTVEEVEVFDITADYPNQLEMTV